MVLFLDNNTPSAKDRLLPKIVGMMKFISAMEAVHDYTAFAVKTTGINKGIDQIIDICALKIEKDKIVDEFSCLIKPDFDLPWFVEDASAIDDAMLSGAASADKVLPGFIEFIGNDTLVAFNVCGFDLDILNTQLQDCGLPAFNNKVVDCLKVSQLVNPGFNKTGLVDLVRYAQLTTKISFSSKPLRRAKDECEAIKYVYEFMRPELEYALLKKIQVPTYKNKSKKYKKVKPTLDVCSLNPLYEMRVALASDLPEGWNRQELVQNLVNLGVQIEDDITKQTDYMLCNKDNIQIADGAVGGKMKKALKYYADSQKPQALTFRTLASLIDQWL